MEKSVRKVGIVEFSQKQWIVAIYVAAILPDLDQTIVQNVVCVKQAPSILGRFNLPWKNQVLWVTGTQRLPLCKTRKPPAVEGITYKNRIRGSVITSPLYSLV